MTGGVLALDLGTSGLKAVVFDLEGQVVASAGASYETIYRDDGTAEQNPEDWLQAIGEAVSDLRGRDVDLSGIGVIGVSGHMMGAVAVSAAGEAIGPALIHADTRAVAQAAELQKHVGPENVYRITGHRASASYSGPKITWMRDNRSEVYQAAETFLNPKDYVNLQLTGVTATEWTDASGTLLFDLSTRKWSPELLEACRIDGHKMPEVVPSTAVIGNVTPAAARVTGLPQGVSVVAGAGDGICAGVGAGSVAPGQAYNYLGTTSWVATTADAPLIDPQMRVFTFAHAVEGLFHPTGTMQTAGGAVDWFCNTSLAHIPGKANAYAMLDKLVSESPPGSRGVLFLPYLLGERSPWWNPRCSASWVGLRQHHTLADQARAVLEGVAASLSLIAEVLTEFTPVESLRLLGGGGLSRHWPQILCDAYGRPLTVMEDTSSVTARGAAVIAGVGAGIFSDFSVAEKFAMVADELQPVPEGVSRMGEVRNRLAATYRQLNPTDG